MMKMPIFWRYLIGHYLKVLFLVVLSFIAILLVSRLEEISQFAALGASLHYLSLFIFYQIPYILPIALPISCAISSMILFQRLSQSHELTAFRACGFSLKTILTPLLLTSGFLSLGNFYITSELSTSSHLATRKMAYEISSVNPIILLQNAKIAQLNGAYVQMDPLRNGEAAENLLIALQNKPNERLNLILAKKIEMKEKSLCGSQVSLISSMPSGEANDFDHLMIENQETSSSSAPQFASLLHKQGWKIANDHLKFSLLLVRIHAFKEKIALFKKAENIQKASNAIKDVQRVLQKCYSEMIRRFSFALAPFTFTLMGIAFGMEISRNQSRRGVLIVVFLSALSLISFFVAKELDMFFFIAATLFLLPHALILGVSFFTLNRINRGIE